MFADFFRSAFFSMLNVLEYKFTARDMCAEKKLFPKTKTQKKISISSHTQAELMELFISLVYMILFMFRTLKVEQIESQGREEKRRALQVKMVDSGSRNVAFGIKKLSGARVDCPYQNRAWNCLLRRKLTSKVRSIKLI